MVFIKSVVNADAGTADKVGGNDWDILDSYFDDTDITPKIAKINTITKFRSSKFYQQNPANTFSYITVGSAITANRNVTEPLLTGADTRVYEAHPQNLGNKTALSTSNVAAAVGGGTPTNINTEGVGLFKQKSGSNNEFYGISPGSAGITTTLHPGTAAAQIDVIESMLNKDFMAGGVFLRLMDELNVGNTAAETEIFSCLIPGGKLETNKMLRLTINGDYLGNGAADRTMTLKIKYGATTLYNDVTNTMGTTASRRAMRFVIELCNRNVTNSQALGGLLLISDAGGTTNGLGDFADDETFAYTCISGVSTEDSTDDLSLVVTITHSAAEANVSYRRQYAVLEVV
jgi:hypothetical protein